MPARRKAPPATTPSRAPSRAPEARTAKSSAPLARRNSSKSAPVTKGAAKPKPSKKGVALQNATPAAAAELYRALAALYPDAHCELDFQSPYQLLAATILSAQCTDKRVNMVTPELFRRFPSPEALARAQPEEVEAIIRTTGFFRAKAKSLIGMAGAITDRHGGEVPSSMDALVVLPGVGRKTANVVLGNAFDINVGVVVDTHVGRLANRLGLTSDTDPIKVEQALMRLFPPAQWTMLSHLLIWHGRRVCDARKPRSAACPVAGRCPSAQRPA